MLSDGVKEKLEDLLQFNEAKIAELEQATYAPGSRGAELLEHLRRHNAVLHRMLD